ncbi:MAG TPA: type I 3-dehydroquinate dehydratase [Clostridiaceae bacterium]|nr:type I 3-dehydroquinate dehydratase [Clostridiaceae bacterium]
MDTGNGRIVTVKDVVIGEGIPKICVSLTAGTTEGILSEAQELKDYPVDIVEWRADGFEDVMDGEKVSGVLTSLQQVLEGRPLLFTLRSDREGGALSVRPEVYAGLCVAAVQSGLVDLIDVEAFTEDKVVREIIAEARKAGVAVIASYHDFGKTPSKDGMFQRLQKMGETGADILKIAVMPQSKSDVLTLLDATVTMKEQHPERPLVTMSMGQDGLISRLTGEVFGSAMTFGSIGSRVSAPGQMDVVELDRVMRIIHDNLAK